MAKIIKYIFLLLFFWGCSLNANYCMAVDGIWVPEKIDWSYPEIKGMENNRSAYITIMNFLSDGTFKMYKCRVYYTNDGLFSISVPEAFSIFKGKWKKENDKKVVLEYKAIYRTIKITKVDGGDAPDENAKETFYLDTTHTDAIKLYNDKNVFIKNSQFTEKSMTFMSRW